MEAVCSLYINLQRYTVSQPTTWPAFILRTRKLVGLTGVVVGQN